MVKKPTVPIVRWHGVVLPFSLVSLNLGIINYGIRMQRCTGLSFENLRKL